MILIVLILIVLPLILAVVNLSFLLFDKKRPTFEGISFGLAILLSLLLDTMAEMPEYTKPLYSNMAADTHTFLARPYGFTVLVLFFVGLICYMFLKFGRNTKPPLLRVLLMGGTYIGCLISGTVILQLVGGILKNQTNQYFFVLYMCILPLMFILNAVVCLVRLVRSSAREQEGMEYGQGWIRKINLFLVKVNHDGLFALIAMLPILLICITLLCLFGQVPDSAIRAFTHTSDWLLSTKISPPPVECDGHYLCTVALRGHKKIVKPLRYGLRRGNKIVVNRQLCVANAFEELIMERTPRVHKKVRTFYDTYGYPVSRLIRSRWAADMIYLLMKPLEWFFVGTLYLLDEKPENRIERQYLPKTV